MEDGWEEEMKTTCTQQKERAMSRVTFQKQVKR